MFVCPAVSFSTYPVQPRLRGGYVPTTLVLSSASHSTLTFPTYFKHQKIRVLHFIKVVTHEILQQLKQDNTEKSIVGPKKKKQKNSECEIKGEEN